MIKKIIILISLLGWLIGNIFSYWIEDIKKWYNKKLDNFEKIIELKYTNKIKVCYYKNKKYENLNKILISYKNKYPKYINIFNILLEINKYRQIKFANNCKKTNNFEKNELNENKWNNTINTNIINNNSNNILTWQENTNYSKITFKLDTSKYDYNDNISLSWYYIENNIELPKIWEIEQIYNNFTIRINNYWILLEKMFIAKDIDEKHLSDNINYFKKKYDKDYIFYKKIEDKYMVYIANKNYIHILNPFDPTKSEDYNVNQLLKAWYLYIKDFFYKKTNDKKTNDKNIIISWLLKFNNKLYYLSMTWTWQYYEISKKDLIQNILNIKKWSIIVDWQDKLIAWKDWIKLFYLWNFDIYKNINLERFWKIINFTFYTIWKNNFSYNVQDMYDFINFAKQFDWKSLKDLYQWIIENYTYNKNINNILNEKSMNQEILNNKVDTDKKLIQNWNIFYSLKKKEWVCQSISDIFSLVALFNWQDADTIMWMNKKSYLHQVSKINWRYYDPTFDLDNDKKINYFNIWKEEIQKYLDLKNN